MTFGESVALKQISLRMKRFGCGYRGAHRKGKSFWFSSLPVCWTPRGSCAADARIPVVRTADVPTNWVRSQETFLFSATLGQNIAGCEVATNSKIRIAADLAGLSADVELSVGIRNDRR